MNTMALIERVIGSGIKLQLESGRLKITAPKNTLSPQLLEEIKSKKQEIIELLAGMDNHTPIEPVEKKDYYHVSSTQKRLYILQQLELTGTSYNMPMAVPLGKGIEDQRVEETFRKLIARHESLRTSFLMVNENPVQKINETVEFKIEQETGPQKTQTDTTQAVKKFIRHFELSEAPLLRAALIKTPDENHILLMDMHHIVTDGTSHTILTREFTALYAGVEFTPLRLQYKDYSEWLNREEQQKSIKQQESYWLKTFAHELPILDLPYDYPRPGIQNFEGYSQNFILPEKETRDLKNTAEAFETTLYTLLLAVFNILLSKLCRQEDIIIGTPIAARRHIDLQPIVGIFVNTLPMRNYPSGHKTVAQFLKEVKKETLKAYENQEYPFEELVDKISPRRDTSRNPIFDVMFNLMNQAEHPGDITGTDPQNDNEFIPTTSKFDLNLTAVEIGEKLFFNLEYCIKLFKANTIARIIEYFKRINSLLPQKIDQKLANIQIITGEEKNKLLFEFNNTKADFPEYKTVHGLFQEQVEKSSHHIALILGHLQLTYKELNKKANQLARLLGNNGIKTNDIVVLMTERTVEMVIGMIGIMKAGAAYLPIDPAYPDERKKYMLEDSSVKILLKNIEIEQELSGNPGIKTIELADKNIYRGEDRNPTPVNKPSDLAYVIYTSGSTGKPKGVLLEHRNLVNLLLYGFTYTNLDFSVVLQFAAISFDASFHEIFSTLPSGGKLCLIHKETRTNILELFKVIRRNNIKTVFLPMSLLKIIFNEENYTAIFPRCVRHIQTAGEQVVVSDSFRNYLKENNIYLHNHYGPSETHVVTALTMDPRDEIPQLPPIGKPVSNTTTLILDKYGNLQPVKVAGELYIGGIQVGRGYLNKPGLTAEKFGRDGYHRSHRLYKSYNFYKTGDLARWLPDGNIEFLGRIDFQVKIRGFRIEPGEIESHLLNHETIHEAVVQVKEDPEKEKYLCAYIVTKNTGTKTDSLALRDYLSKKLPDYMIPNRFIDIDTIPLTPSGKIDRKALPEPGIKAEPGYIAPRSHVEEKLAEMWAEVLGIDRNIIGIDANFFELGGHSLKGTRLISKIHKEFHVNLPLVELFRAPTIKGFAQHIKKAAPDKFISIEPVEKKEFYDVSYSQRRLWSVAQFEKEQTAYNLPMALEIKQLNREAFEKAFKTLVIRHESLRTTFLTIKGEPKQEIHDPGSFGFNIKYIDLREKEKAEETAKKQVHQETQTVFDLDTPPLIRVTLLHLRDERYLCIIVMHHIISDGWSMEVASREVLALYYAYVKNKEKPLTPLKIQYKDFSQWQNVQLSEKNLNAHRHYWLKQFAGEIPILKLKTDYPRPQFQTFNGDSISFNLDNKIIPGLNKISKRNEASLFMTLLAAVKVLLYYYTGQIDIVIGTPVAGREHSDLENQIGYYLNILPLRTTFTANENFEQLLSRIKHITLAAYNHQVYPFDLLINDLKLKRQTGRSPLFDVLVHMLNTEMEPQRETKNRETPVNSREIDLKDSKFDLTVNFFEGAHRVQFKFNTDLFKRKTIMRMTERFKTLLENIVKNTTSPISRLKAEKELRLPTLQPISIKSEL